jgi:hypothetical protein
MHTNDNLVNNPYLFGKPIYEIEKLVGRNDILRRIEYNIINNSIKITLLHVQRRIGKTSLITCLPQYFAKEQNGVKFVTFSFQGYKDKQIPEILNYLADEIAATIDGLPKQEREKADGTHNFFERFLPIIIDKYLSGKKLVLLLDEFDILEEDKITKNNQGKQIFNQLKNAVNQQEKLFAILVFGRPLKDMDYLEAFLQKEGQKAIEVGLLDKESTKKLIVDPAKEILDYKESAIDRIWELSAGHPYLTQLLCSNIFNYCKEKKIVQTGDVDSILSKAMEEGEPVLQGFIQPLSNIEKFFFRAVAEAQEIGTDPLNILKNATPTVETEYLRPAEKRLVELGFLETKDTKIKVKVELVRLWLLKNYPLLDGEDRKRIKNNMTQPKSDRPNPIAKSIAFLVMVAIAFSFALYLNYGIRRSGNSRRTERECFKLSEEISKALEDKRNTRKQLQVIEQVRTEWSREKEGLLDKQCPYPSELNAKYNLDAKYNELLQYYGQSQVYNTGNFDKGIEALCEITSKYKDLPYIKKIFERWVLINQRLSTNKNTKRVLNKIIEQNQSRNDCPAYSFKNDRNKNELYDQKAQVHANDYEYDQAVESYCQITSNYYDFETVVKQLEKWLSSEFDQPYSRPEDVEKVEEKLKELKNQCQAFPPSLDN